MSVRVMTAVWDLDLPDSEKIVLLALADCANDEGHCWPSMATLAKKCSKSERTTQGAIKALVEAGHLTRREVVGKGCNYSVHPRSRCAPANPAPPQPATKTPAAAADKPSKNHKPKTTRPAREHEIPDDWKPAQFGRGTKSREIVDGWDADDLATQTEHFIAHHRGHGNKFKDWQDAWSTWALNSKRFNRNGRSANLSRPERRDNTGGLSSLDQQFTAIVSARRDREAGGSDRPALAGGGQGRVVSLPAPDSPGWDDGQGPARMAAGGL